MNLFPFRTVRQAAVAALFAWIAGNATPVFADTLAYWNPAGTVDTSSPLPPTSVSASLTSAGDLSGGPGLTGGSWANAYALDNWPAGALDTGDYLAFSTTGSNVTYASVVFSLYNNFDGSGNWEIRSSVDGYTAALDSGTFSGIFAGGELLSANVGALGVRSGTVLFRLYTYNNSGETNPLQRGIRGTGGGGAGLSVIGSAATVKTASVQSAPALGNAAVLLLAALLAAFAWRRSLRS